MLKNKIFPLFFLCLSLCTFQTLLAQAPVVRVKLAETKNQFTVKSDKPMQVLAFRKGITASQLEGAKGIAIRFDKSRISLLKSGRVIAKGLDSVKVSPGEGAGYLSLDKKKYRGRLLLAITSPGRRLLAVNYVDLEEYLQGVVPLEMGIKLITNDSEFQALKVQAVAARTYALSKLGLFPDRLFDVEATVADQMYGGLEDEKELVDSAVMQTAGEILVTTDSQSVKCYFHANCGGQTEELGKVWPWKTPENYLVSVWDSNYCDWAKNYAWEETYSRKEIEESIRNFLAPANGGSSFVLGALLDLQVAEWAPSSRVGLLKITTEEGSWAVRADSIRWCFRRKSPRGAILPSTKFDLEIARNEDEEIVSVRFSGCGNGHGVGLCQIGAIGRARAGFTYSEILTAYYPGTRLIKRY